MHNPFEENSLRWHIFNELQAELQRKEKLTALELVNIINEIAPDETPTPPPAHTKPQKHKT